MKHIVLLVALACAFMSSCSEAQGGSRTSQRKLVSKEEQAEPMEEQTAYISSDTLDYNVESNVTNDSVSLAAKTYVIPCVANPSTGYDWQMSVEPSDSSVVKFNGITYEKKSSDEPMMMGAPSSRNYNFELTGTGTVAIKFIYKRVWETKEAPIAEAVYNLTITE